MKGFVQACTAIVDDAAVPRRPLEWRGTGRDGVPAVDTARTAINRVL